MPPVPSSSSPASVDEVVAGLRAHDYLPDEGLATAVFLSLRLQRPLLLEGEAGVGKTEVAKALAALHKAELIRLQCYEGLDHNAALYEWNYQRQLLAIKAREGAEEDPDHVEEHIFSERYLIERPLLAAIRRIDPPVLLIDEVDRADEEFEAYLLELLSDFQVTIPELGTVSAVRRPLVLLTSNATRELSEALRRRCLYLHLDYPAADRERRIVETRVPGVDHDLAAAVVEVVGRLRGLDLRKSPSIAESVDWARTLVALGIRSLDDAAVERTLGVVLKHASDQERAVRELRLRSA